jgi:hypothetical protein
MRNESMSRLGRRMTWLASSMWSISANGITIAGRLAKGQGHQRLSA